MDEHRRTHRVPFECFVTFKTSDSSFVCELYDISMQGALIGACSGATPASGTPCMLIINLDEEHVHRIIMHGFVAHKIENRVGISCNHIDSESLMHLRKLIELNLGDSELANRDFNALISSR